MDGWMNGPIKWSMNWWIDGLTDGSIDRSMYWSMVRWFDGSIDWNPCRRQRELESVCVWDREWGFLHCRWKVNTFQDIVYGSQCKWKRKSWFLFYSFLWTFGRLPNIKRWKFSTAHMPGRWRGGRWSIKCQLGRCTNQRWGAQARTHVIAQWFFDISEFLFFRIKKLAMRTNGIKI